MYSSMKDIEPVSDRIMRATFDAPAPITIVSVYAPTAAASTQEKDHFYDTLSEVVDKWRNRGPVYIMGDWNARIQQCRQ
eukprot:10503707-Prorocentrum_lima.AAC.1